MSGFVESTWLHVCRDDTRMQRFADALGFFHPGLEVLSLPAWDCLPYDRIGPSAGHADFTNPCSDGRLQRSSLALAVEQL